MRCGRAWVHHRFGLLLHARLALASLLNDLIQSVVSNRYSLPSCPKQTGSRHGCVQQREMEGSAAGGRFLHQTKHEWGKARPRALSRTHSCLGFGGWKARGRARRARSWQLSSGAAGRGRWFELAARWSSSPLTAVSGPPPRLLPRGPQRAAPTAGGAAAAQAAAQHVCVRGRDCRRVVDCVAGGASPRAVPTHARSLAGGAASLAPTTAAGDTSAGRCERAL
jgi:hypothetical protein